jgi:hypothetical protein
METKLNRINSYLLTSILALTLALIGASTASAQQNVKVVNTDREPVPTVARGVTPVRDIDQPARQPFYASDISGIQTFDTLHSLVYTVPEGKRAVIEQVSIRTLSYSGNRFPIDIYMTVDPDGIDSPSSKVLFLPPGNPMPSSPAQTFAISTHQIRFYAEPNSTISFHIRGLSSSILWSSHCTVSGYLIDIGGR